MAHRELEQAVALPDEIRDGHVLLAIGHALTGLLELQLGGWPEEKEEGS